MTQLFLMGFDPDALIPAPNSTTDFDAVLGELFGEPAVVATATATAIQKPVVLNDGSVSLSPPTLFDIGAATAASNVDQGDFFSVSATVPVAVAEEPPVEVAVTVPVAPITFSKVLVQPAKELATAPWPVLTHEDIACVNGDVAKFDANIAAIELSRVLAAEQREPTLDERLCLQRYTGWGGLQKAISENSGWSERRNILRSLVSEEEFKTLRGSVLNAHYTEVPIVEAMWKMVQKLGFNGGRILDPAAGTGMFYGAMPADIAMKSEMHAVELDVVSAQIHNSLYGHACRTVNQGFEESSYPPSWFDLVISNVPFGNYPVPCKAREAYSGWSIHNYFLAKSLDLVRPNGLVAIITSTHTMDSSKNARRKWLQTRAELVAAFRMPNSAFKRIANTETTTDILIFRRRAAGEAVGANEQQFVDRKEIPQSCVNGNLAASLREINEYWINNPSHVLGEYSAQYGGQYGRASLVVTPSAADLNGSLDRMIDALPEGLYHPAAVVNAVELVDISGMAHDEHKEGSFVIVGGKVHRKAYGRLVASDQGATKTARIAGLVGIRDTARQLLASQIDPNATEAEISKLRKQLNMKYDMFVSKNGPIYSRGNNLAFRSDPDWPLLLALEDFDEESGIATKAAIFSERTTRPVSPPKSADSPEMAVSLSMAEFGHVNLGYLAQLLGTSETDAIAELVSAGLVFLDPESRQYQSRDEYLSGNVRIKLMAAQSAGAEFEVNVVALQEVIPEDLKPGEIEARLGVHWVLPSEYRQFIAHLAGEDYMRYATSMEVVFDPVTGAWSVTNKRTDQGFDARWGVKEITALDLFEKSMNGRSVTIKFCEIIDGSERWFVDVEATAAARERQGQLAEEFQKWLWATEERTAQLVRRYNDEFNSLVDRRYDGSNLRLPGFSWFVQPSQHQLNAICRGMTGENLLLAHCVGAGKTLEMQCISMELRRLGLRKKLLHAVPNHMLEQYCGEFLRAYPGAKVLMARKEDFAGDRRREFVARIATGDWDSIVMTHATFMTIQADPRMSEVLIEEMLAEVHMALESAKKEKGNRTQIKQLVKLEKLWVAKLEKLTASWRKDDFFSMSDLGIDHVLVDESHLFKNLVRVSQLDRIAGLPNSNSQRAFDLFVKARCLVALHGNKERGLCLASGTSVANSMAELHVNQRLLQPLTLRKQGLESFDSWAAMFGRVVTSLEVSPDGSSFRMAERFAQFVNLPELMGMVRQFADIQTAEMLNLPTPPISGGGPQVIVCKPNDEQKEYIAKLVQRAENVRNGSVKPDVDNMLSVTTDGRLAALDLRLVEPTASKHIGGKIALCVERAVELWHESESFRGTQLIFCDAGTPATKGFSVYAHLKRGLIDAGVPEHEIAFIHDAKTDREKAQLFKAMREGRKRFLIASTQKGGVGTNIQTRLFAVHQLDVPWRPCDVEQRDGRIARRGNLCELIHLIRYVTEGSFDAYSWQGLAAKMGFISQVLTGKSGLRKAQDISMAALSYEEIKAIACGNPAVKEKAMLDSELRKLEMLRSHFHSTAMNLKFEIQQAKSKIQSGERNLAAIKADEGLMLAAKHLVTFEGRNYTNMDEAVEAISPKYAEFKDMVLGAAERIKLFTFRGLDVQLGGAQYSRGNGSNVILFGNDYVQAKQTFQQARYLLGKIEDMLAVRQQDVIELSGQINRANRAIPIMQAQLAEEFPHTARIQEIVARVVELESDLGMHKSDAGSEALDENSSVVNGNAANVEAFGAEDAEAEEAVAT